MNIKKPNCDKDIISVILSGGSGTRLWPLSRASYPKQLLPLINDCSLLQTSAKRLENIHLNFSSKKAPEKTTTLIIANNRHRFLIAEQLQKVNITADILLEPIARNTAPAIAIAAWKLVKDERKNAIMVVMPSDHLIKNIDSFHQAVIDSIDEIEKNHIVTFGIKPTHAETGYGYIKVQQQKLSGGLQEVDQFVEKPNKETASEYLTSDNYFWNSGIFCFTPETILQEFEKYQPNIYEQTKLAVENAQRDLDFIRIEENAFKACDDVSIDYAIMENSKKIKMLAVDFDWCDLGSWRTMKSIYPEDKDKNVVAGDAVMHKSRNNFIYSKSRLITTVGVENHSIIDTDDALLVMNNDHVEDMSELVEALRKNNADVLKENVVDYRPWGYFRSINKGDSHQVKLIVVNPGASLSLQKHKFRSEHWVVVKGSALVVVDENELLLQENQSVYIPIGSMHRMTNPGEVPLHLIEVQTGSYLGEDDIVRFDDVYNRNAIYDN